MKTTLTTLLGICTLAPACLAFDAVLTDDTYLSLKGTVANQGASQLLRVDSAHAALFKFDLSFLPAGVSADNVSVATLTVFASQVSKPGTIGLYSVNGGWSERAAVQNVNVTPDTGIWGTVPTKTRNVFVRLDVTSVVKGWLSGATNSGVAIGTTNAELLLRSKESSSGNPASLHIELAPLPSQRIIATVCATECVTHCIPTTVYGVNGDTNSYFAAPPALVTVGTNQTVFVVSTAHCGIGPGINGREPVVFYIGYLIPGGTIQAATAPSRVEVFDGSDPINVSYPVTMQGVLTLPPGSYYVGLVASVTSTGGMYSFWSGVTTALVLGQ